MDSIYWHEIECSHALSCSNSGWGTFLTVQFTFINSFEADSEFTHIKSNTFKHYSLNSLNNFKIMYSFRLSNRESISPISFEVHRIRRPLFFLPQVNHNSLMCSIDQSLASADILYISLSIEPDHSKKGLRSNSRVLKHKSASIF
jgi:hypothetical protein